MSKLLDDAKRNGLSEFLRELWTGGEVGMTAKEAIDVLERSCDFHYEETDKCYGCLFENSGWCGEDFHENLLALLKEQDMMTASMRWICGSGGRLGKRRKSEYGYDGKTVRFR